MKCNSLETKSGKPCQNDKVRCPWHKTITLTKDDMIDDTFVATPKVETIPNPRSWYNILRRKAKNV